MVAVSTIGIIAIRKGPFPRRVPRRDIPAETLHPPANEPSPVRIRKDHRES